MYIKGYVIYGLGIFCTTFDFSTAKFAIFDREIAAKFATFDRDKTAKFVVFLPRNSMVPSYK